MERISVEGLDYTHKFSATTIPTPHIRVSMANGGKKTLGGFGVTLKATFANCEQCQQGMPWENVFYHLPLIIYLLFEGKSS